MPRDSANASPAHQFISFGDTLVAKPPMTEEDQDTIPSNPTNLSFQKTREVCSPKIMRKHNDKNLPKIDSFRATDFGSKPKQGLTIHDSPIILAG